MSILLQMLVVALLALAVLGIGYLVARGAAAFSSFNPRSVRLVTKLDWKGRPIKWETRKEYRARMSA